MNPQLTLRDARQQAVHTWCAAAFGDTHASSIPQRGVRLAEEAIEAAQAAGCERAMLHRLVDHVFDRPVGELAQEIGGVGVTLLALSHAANVSADDAERDEFARVLSKPLEHFAERNAAKNAAGFDVQVIATVATPESAEPVAKVLPNTCMCHPETCCCLPFKVKLRGKYLVAGTEQACQTVAEALNRHSTPAARWREAGEADPHGDLYNGERAKLTCGHLTDDEIANAVFLDPSIVNLTAAKERIRWLSRALVAASATPASAGLRPMQPAIDPDAILGLKAP